MSDDVAALGITLDGELAEQASEPDTFPVLPENWPALELFLACATQWRYQPMGGVSGLDATAIAAVMAMHQVPPAEQRDRLAEVQRLERGALDAFNNR